MTQPAIRSVDLGKWYVLAQRDHADSLRELATRGLRLGARRRRATSRERVWALRHVSFEIASGEVVGVVGRNGAGKTTLVKLLGRITQPNEGFAELRGRVGSLLDIGMGFHPDLTGRENVYLGGAMLGMTPADVRRNLDAIVAFAGVDSSLDAPLKTYSSGMHLRLAFAVAAHLESEILLVDEVLSVGDLEFREKCRERMTEMARDGRTVVFISHYFDIVRALCDRVMLLEQGRITGVGPPDQVLDVFRERIGEGGRGPAAELL